MKKIPAYVSAVPALVFGISALLTAAHSSSAFALEPISDFIAAGRDHALGNRIASMTREQGSAKADENFWKLFPSVNALGGYLYNSNASTVTVPSTLNGQPVLDSLGFPTYRDVTVSRHHQLDAVVTLNVPIFDLSAIYRYRAAKAGASAASTDADLAAQQVDLQVSRAYYAFMAGLAARTTVAHHVSAAEELLTTIQHRAETGMATQTQVSSAQLELDQARLSQREIEANLNSARRTLVNLTGRAPDESELVAANDAFPVEGSIEQWSASLDSAPSVRSANAAVNAADAQVKASRTAFLPKINGMASGRYTNNPAFVGKNETFTAGATISMNFDLSQRAKVRGDKATASVARLRQQDALTSARDMVASAYDQVDLNRSRSDSAQLKVRIAAEAANAVYGRFVAGDAPPEEQIRAQRELIGAQLAEAQSVAEYSYSRALLRIAAGRDLSREK